MCARAVLVICLMAAGLSGIALFWLGWSASALWLHVVFLAAAGAGLAVGVFLLGQRLMREGSELDDAVRGRGGR